MMIGVLDRVALCQGAIVSVRETTRVLPMIRHPVPIAQLSIRSAVAILLCTGFFSTRSAHAADAAAPLAGKLSFNHDIQPILSENCYFCHGTDKNQRKVGLRLDSFAEATRDRKGKRPIVPGKSGESEVIKRMLSTDPDEFMPPKDSHREVTPAQIE